MSNILDKICNGFKCLPEKDHYYANAFILRRDFKSLKELVDSDIINVEKNLKKLDPNKDLLEVDVNKLRDYSSLIEQYLILIGEECEQMDYDVLDNIEEDEW